MATLYNIDKHKTSFGAEKYRRGRFMVIAAMVALVVLTVAFTSSFLRPQTPADVIDNVTYVLLFAVMLVGTLFDGLYNMQDEKGTYNGVKKLKGGVTVKVEEGGIGAYSEDGVLLSLLSVPGDVVYWQGTDTQATLDLVGDGSMFLHVDDADLPSLPLQLANAGITVERK